MAKPSRRGADRRPADAVEIARIPIPIDARVLRFRHRKEERVTLYVDRPVALTALSSGEAPVLAGLSVPASQRALYHPFYVGASRIAYVLHDGDRHWRPLVGRDGSYLRPPDLGPLLRAWADDTAPWPDWPYAREERHYGGRRPDLLDLDAIRIVGCDVNPEALHAEAGTELARRICLVDGILHTLCDEPVIDVALPDIGGRTGCNRIVVAPSAGGQLDPDLERDVLFTFRADAWEEASACAHAVSRATGLRVQEGARWDVRGPLARSDAAVGPAEGMARIAARAAASIGSAARPTVEAWLDMRDLGAGRPSADEAVAMLDRMAATAPRPGGLLDRLVAWERMRWRPGDGDAEADLAALGELGLG